MRGFVPSGFLGNSTAAVPWGPRLTPGFTAKPLAAHTAGNSTTKRGSSISSGFDADGAHKLHLQRYDCNTQRVVTAATGDGPNTRGKLRDFIFRLLNGIKRQGSSSLGESSAANPGGYLSNG